MSQRTGDVTLTDLRFVRPKSTMSRAYLSLPWFETPDFWLESILQGTTLGYFINKI
jgi:hypothetical protein